MSHTSTNGFRSGEHGGQRWLTKRESEVAELIARGLTNEQIAEQLVLTPGTVANHVAHILAKLDVQSRVQIATTVVRQNAGGGRGRGWRYPRACNSSKKPPSERYYSTP